MSKNLKESNSTGAQKLINPVHNLNQTALDNLAKVADLHLSNAKYFTDLGINQLKAVSDIKDLDDVRSFTNNSLEIACDMHRKLIADGKEFVDLGAGFKNSIGSLFTKSEAEDTCAVPTKAKNRPL